jgi:hypothetical protein
MIGRIIPIAEVRHELMFLWVLVYIHDQAHQIGFAVYRNSFEWTLEQRSSALHSNIDSPSVGIEKVGKTLAGFPDLKT